MFGQRQVLIANVCYLPDSVAVDVAVVVVTLVVVVAAALIVV